MELQGTTKQGKPRLLQIERKDDRFYLCIHPPESEAGYEIWVDAAHLGHALINATSPSSNEAQADELSPEQHAEIRRRIEESDRGEVELLDGDEVMRKARAFVKQVRQP